MSLTQHLDTQSGAARTTASIRTSPHERLTALGLVPVARATQFAADIQALMARTPLFAGLEPSETLRLCSFMYVYEAPPGVMVIAEGEAGDFMMILMQGMVDVLRRNRYNHPTRIAVA